MNRLVILGNLSQSKVDAERAELVDAIAGPSGHALQ